MTFPAKYLSTRTFVILKLREGLGFAHVRKKLIRVSALLKDSPLSSNFVYMGAAPSFKCNLIWHVENQQLKNLQKENIKIMISVTGSDNGVDEVLIGVAVIPLRKAEFSESYEPSHCKSLDLQGEKLPFGIRKPQIFVSLSLQSYLRVKSTDASYTAIIDPHHVNTFKVSSYINKQFSDIHTNLVAEKTQKGKCDNTRNKVQETQMGVTRKLQNRGTQTVDVALLKQDKGQQVAKSGSHSQRRKIVEESIVEPKNILKKPLDTKKIILGQLKNISKKEFIPKCDKKQATQTSQPDNIKKNVDNAEHIYQLEIKIEKLDWFIQLTDTEIFIKFYNPHTNSSVDVIKRGQLEYLTLSNIKCLVFYKTVQSKLLQIILNNPPQVFIFKVSNKKLIVKGTLKVENLKIIPETDIFECDIPLTDKYNTRIGNIKTAIEFHKKDDVESLDTKIKFKDVSLAMYENLQNLMKVLSKLQDMSDKMSITFENMIDNTTERGRKEELKKRRVPLDISKINAQKSSTLKSKSKNTNITTTLKSQSKNTNVTDVASKDKQLSVQRRCKYCKQSFIVNYTSAKLDEEITYLCKDCIVITIQSDLAETVDKCKKETNAVKKEIKDLKEQTKIKSAHSVQEQNASSIKNSLSVLLTHTKSQKSYLYDKCKKIYDRLEVLKHLIPIQEVHEHNEETLEHDKENENQEKQNPENEWEEMKACDISVLKQEILGYRKEQEEKNTVLRNTLAEQEQKKKKTDGTLTSRASIRSRCEACQYIQRQLTTQAISSSKKSDLKNVSAGKQKNTKRNLTNELSNLFEEHIHLVQLLLQRYLEKRDKLIRLKGYHFGDAEIAEMTNIIHKLLIEWKQLKSTDYICTLHRFNL